MGQVGPSSLQEESRSPRLPGLGQGPRPLAVRGRPPVLLAECGWFLGCSGPSRQPSWGWPVGTESSWLAVSLKAIMCPPLAEAEPWRHPASRWHQCFPGTGTGTGFVIPRNSGTFCIIQCGNLFMFCRAKTKQLLFMLQYLCFTRNNSIFIEHLQNYIFFKKQK